MAGEQENNVFGTGLSMPKCRLLPNRKAVW